MTTSVNESLRKQDELQSDKILRCLRTDDGKVLIEYLLDLHHRYSTQLKTNREPVDIYRNQGKIESLELILRMQEEK